MTLCVWPLDHEPRHVHAFVGGTEVIVELHGDGKVVVADRKDAARRAKRLAVRYALAAAEVAYDQLVALCKEMHP